MQKTREPLSSPLAHHLQAAVGWLELRDCLEAELDQVSIAQRMPPDISEVRWRICANNMNEWDGCWFIANALTIEVPKRPTNWLYLAEATRWATVYRPEPGWRVHLSVAERFHKIPAIHKKL